MRKERIVAVESVGLRDRRAGEGTVEPSHQEMREGVPCCGVSGKKDRLGVQRKED